MKFEIPALNYSYEELSPFISAATVEVHYEKHHQGYIDKLNNSDYVVQNPNESLEDIICSADGDDFNNAAQTWNHNLMWQCINPMGLRKPSDSFLPVIKTHFGSLEQFKRDLSEAAKSQFGSGWAWIVLDENNKLKITKSSNADNPMRDKLKPLFTIDVWEHAYYLDYKNQRGDYLDAVINHLFDWEFLELQYSKHTTK